MTGGGWEVRWSALLLVLLLCRVVVRRTSYEERERGQRRTAGEEAVLAEDGDRVDEEHGDVEEAAEEEHRGRMGCAHAMGGGAGRLGFVVVCRCASLRLVGPSPDDDVAVGEGSGCPAAWVGSTARIEETFRGVEAVGGMGWDGAARASPFCCLVWPVWWSSSVGGLAREVEVPGWLLAVWRDEGQVADGDWLRRSEKVWGVGVGGERELAHPACTEYIALLQWPATSPLRSKQASKQASPLFC